MVTADVIETITRATTELCQMLREHEAVIKDQDETITRLTERCNEQRRSLDDKDGLIEGLKHQRAHLTQDRGSLQEQLDDTCKQLEAEALARTKAENELNKLRDIILNVATAVDSVVNPPSSPVQPATNVVPMPPPNEPMPIQDERAANGPVGPLTTVALPRPYWESKPDLIASVDPYYNHGQEPFNEPVPGEVKEPSDPFAHAVNF